MFRCHIESCKQIQKLPLSPFINISINPKIFEIMINWIEGTIYEMRLTLLSKCFKFLALLVSGNVIFAKRHKEATLWIFHAKNFNIITCTRCLAFICITFFDSICIFDCVKITTYIHVGLQLTWISIHHRDRIFSKSTQWTIYRHTLAIAFSIHSGLRKLPFNIIVSNMCTYSHAKLEVDWIEICRDMAFVAK